ncbi:hypothetical protein Q4E93_34365 [Flavitalea sp. BT771]|uniref:hypothetical protein n=1 Tax=Flavitalea sp. BT771 TaxID=3063329 RepID=UPI0026E120C4|nr:hypothetical protein [Flavitalea sp. BT771]MDO6435750.1 hypothetical protein [Flavitalea sp. BT771]MDV6224651.1 hypothetical protein [Flavitalea sp. BT771]
MGKSLSPKPKRWGMIQYTILEDGNLHGIWTHSDKAGDGAPGGRRLFLEIARKVDDRHDTLQSRAQLVGAYNCAWVDEPTDLGVLQQLTIGQQGTVYTFEWRTATGVSFTGVGMRLGPTTLVVTFWPGADRQHTLSAS